MKTVFHQLAEDVFERLDVQKKKRKPKIEPKIEPTNEPKEKTLPFKMNLVSRQSQLRKRLAEANENDFKKSEKKTPKKRDKGTIENLNNNSKG